MRHDVTFPAVCRGRRDLQSRLPGVARAITSSIRCRPPRPVSIGAINMLGLAKRVKAKIFQASTERGLRRSRRCIRRPKIIAATSIRSVRAPAMTRASAAPRRCSSIIIVSIACGSRWRASSTPMARACTPSDGRVVSNFIMQALTGQPITLYGNRHADPGVLLRRRSGRGLRPADGDGGRGHRPDQSRQPPRDFGSRAGRADDHADRLQIGDSSFAPLPQDDPDASAVPTSAWRGDVWDWQPRVPLEDGLRERSLFRPHAVERGTVRRSS